MKIKTIVDKHILINIHVSRINADLRDFKAFYRSLNKNSKDLYQLIMKCTALKNCLKGEKKVKIDLTFCGDTKMRRINLNFRNKDKTTDVLSFPQFDSLRKRISRQDLVFVDNPQGELFLGDLLISMNVAKKQAKRYNASLKEELERLFVHGLLHLLGYDHEVSPKEEKLMFRLQDDFLKTL